MSWSLKTGTRLLTGREELSLLEHPLVGKVQLAAGEQQAAVHGHQSGDVVIPGQNGFSLIPEFFRRRSRTLPHRVASPPGTRHENLFIRCILKKRSGIMAFVWMKGSFACGERCPMTG